MLKTYQKKIKLISQRKKTYESEVLSIVEALSQSSNIAEGDAASQVKMLLEANTLATFMDLFFELPPESDLKSPLAWSIQALTDSNSTYKCTDQRN